MLSSSDDEDDPVATEIDIYLAKGLAEKLLLFQYPVRPSTGTYDFVSHLAARIKPVQQKVELQIDIDTNSATYCYARGEQIAHAVDKDDQCQGSSNPNPKQHFPANIMDRQLLTSVKATEDSSKYAAAIYCNGAIHVTPIKGIFQLHPSFTYFDKAEENQKKSMASENCNVGDTDDEGDAKPVQLRFAKGQNLKKKDQLKAKIIEENWVEAQFYQPQDRRAVMERNLLFCHQADFDSPEFTVTSRDYLKILSPSEQQGAESPADLPHGVLSLLKLKGMSLTDQIKALLITAKVLQFTQLCALLGGGMDVNVVLTALTQYAMLVQGCWVVKSNILYPEGTKSHISGLDATKLWPSRDYVMFCFNRKRVLSRKEVASNTRLPTEELREVLEQIGKQRPAQGWEFMLNTDNDFLKSHREECLNQLSLWRQRYKEIAESLNLSEEFCESDWNEMNFPGLFPGFGRKTATRRRIPSQSAGSSNDNEKAKPKSHRRTKSQSSEDGSILPEPKDEHISPLRKTSTDKLKLAISCASQNSQNKIVSPKLSHKLSKRSPMKSLLKSPIRLGRETPNTDANVEDKINLGMAIDDIKLESEDFTEKVNIGFEIDQNNVDCSNYSGVINGSMHLDKIRHVHFTQSGGQPHGDIKTENVEIMEDIEDIDQNLRKRKCKKRVATILSDESEEEVVGINKVSGESMSIFIEDAGKPMNEIEVTDINSACRDNGIYMHNYSENSEEIFVPPVVAGGRIIRDDQERPPSDIFIKELKKFCQEAIQSGCLSLMELKEVLHIRQQEAGNILCTGVSDELLVQAAKDSGAFEVPVRWEEPNEMPVERKRLFLYRNLGEHTDKYRSIVVDLFSAFQSLRRKDIFEAFTRTLNEVPSSHMYTKIISEFCQNHHGQWYLNGTYTAIHKYSNS